MRKKILSGLMILGLYSITVQAVIYDPIVKGTTWKQSEKNTLMSHCLTMTENVETWKERLPAANNRENVCNCIVDELMQLTTYQDFLTMNKIQFRKAGIDAGKYFKPAIQSAEDKRVYDMYKNLDAVVLGKCATNEVANEGAIEKVKELQAEHPDWILQTNVLE